MLSAMRANLFRSGLHVQKSRQYLACLVFTGIVHDPHFGLSLQEGNLAQRTRGVGIENMAGDAKTGQRVDSQLGIEQGGGDVNPFH